MSFKKLKRIIEQSDDSFDIYEYSLQEVIDKFQELIQSIDSIIEDENYGVKEDTLKRANLVKGYLIKAIEEGRQQIQEDGTLGDLGQLPQLPFGIVDARGQSKSLYGAKPVKKKRKKKNEEVIGFEKVIKFVPKTGNMKDGKRPEDMRILKTRSDGKEYYLVQGNTGKGLGWVTYAEHPDEESATKDLENWY